MGRQPPRLPLLNPQRTRLTIRNDLSLKRSELQLVSHFHPAGADLPRREFQHAMCFEVDAGNPEWSQPMPKLQHLQAPTERHYINRKQHAKRMDSG
jgi:hypothetical protein